ncbi:MAG: adenosine deaminase [Propionibacteriaceae bacterium]|jgi:adenosine deaminase|nr:adenosine deaminase [Propionibacteriaceae bacterium]
MSARDHIRALPKAELHLHIEGTLEPDLAFRLARRNGVELPWADEAALAKAMDFSDLQSFLDVYYQAMAALRTPADFADLMDAYLTRARADGVRHAEIFFDPQVHIGNGVAFDDVVDGLLEGWRSHTDVSGGLIMCFLRDRGPEAAADLLAAARHRAGDLIGVGLDSAEVGNPPEPFADVFAQARGLGLRAVAHAGEEGGPEYVWGALRALGAERIDHGIRVLEDDALVGELVARQVPLTVCPLSNVRLKAVAGHAAHPFPELLARGLKVTVNSDDPAYFGGYLAANFECLDDAFGLQPQTLATLCRNSIEASFAAPERQAELLAELGAAAQ